MRASRQEDGFVILLVIVVIAIIASLWLSTKYEKSISFFKNEQIESNMGELERVKDRLLAFAVLQPEIYMTDDSGDERDAASIPSPGYFPCPDLVGDGDLTGNETNCGYPYVTGDDTTGFVPKPDRNEGGGLCDGSGTCLGYVPERISTRNFYFAPAKRYFYFLDERYSFSNQNYYGAPDFANRYAPLYPDKLDPTLSVNPPGLTLNGQAGYVAIVIDPGADGVLDSVNQDGDSVFVANISTLSNSDNLDKAIGITYDEWFWWMAQRICKEYPRLITVDENRAHWFNDYRDSFDANPNIGGSNWRSWGDVCI